MTKRTTVVVIGSLMVKTCTTVFTISIGTDRPEQTVSPEKMPQNAMSDKGLHCHSAVFRHISR